MVLRRRLLDVLDAAVERPLTLLSAPPGTGKTALLASWVRSGAPPGPVGWLSLDPADGDRRRFWRAAREALAGAGVRDLAGGIGDDPRSSTDVHVRAITAALSERAEPVVLVLDDFHEVGDRVHADLDRLLLHPPPALRLVIATRADPPMRLGRLRVQDQLVELREPELAMTVDETVQMLAAGGVSLADEHVRRLWEHTEGWAGALRLAARSMRGHADPERFVDDFAGDDRAISDYLLSEVMSGVSADDRHFLLSTSVVSVLNGALADALTGRSDGHRRLGELERGGALIAPLDRRGDSYRYHALFRELLQAELRSDFPDRLPELHRRAAEWFVANGDDESGLVHAVHAEAWDLAAQLAGERWVDLLIRGEAGALWPLVDHLPPQWTVDDPEVALALASTLLDRGDHASAGRLLKQAAAAAARVPEERRARFAVSSSALELYVARLRGDLAGALESGRELARRGALERGVIDAGLRALALVNLGIAELWTGEPAAAERHLERARGAATDAGHEWLVLVALSHLAVLSGMTFDYPRSARYAAEALELAAEHGWRESWPAGAALLARAGAEVLWDRGDEAAHTVELAQRALAGTQERPLRAGLAILRAASLASRGEHESALAVLEAGQEELGDFPLPAILGDQFSLKAAGLHAQLGNRGRAAQALEEIPGSLRTAVMLGQLQLADGEAEAARETIAGWLEHLDGDLSPFAVQAWLVDALALDLAADHDGAAASLERALDAAEPAGLRSAVLQFGRSLQPLLTRQLRRGTAHRALVGDILDALDGDPGQPRVRASLVVEALSPRERAVLRFLPTMMSNQEIAAELFVSINTVKTHLKSIYRKLDVTDRREAVRRARRLELLAPSAGDAGPRSAPGRAPEHGR